MRMKVSNYISEMLVKAGIHQAFMVTGGRKDKAVIVFYKGCYLVSF